MNTKDGLQKSGSNMSPYMHFLEMGSRWQNGRLLGPKVVGRLFNCGHRLEAGAAFSVLLSIAEASLASHTPTISSAGWDRIKVLSGVEAGAVSAAKVSDGKTSAAAFSRTRQRELIVVFGGITESLLPDNETTAAWVFGGMFWISDQWASFFCVAAIGTFWAKQIEPTVWITFISGFEMEELKMYW